MGKKIKYFIAITRKTAQEKYKKDIINYWKLLDHRCDQLGYQSILWIVQNEDHMQVHG